MPGEGQMVSPTWLAVMCSSLTGRQIWQAWGSDRRRLFKSSLMLSILE